MILGVCGKYCSGKNTVARFFEERGFLHLDADRLAHQALEEVRDEAVGLFGPGILKPAPDAPAGRVDRRALAGIVFRDRAALGRLEALIHPRVIVMMEKAMRENPGRDILLNAPLLFESGLDAGCDRVILVSAPAALRFLRALERDKAGPAAAAARIWAQRGLKTQSSSGNADIIRVKNGGSSAGLRRRLAEVIVELRV